LNDRSALPVTAEHLRTYAEEGAVLVPGAFSTAWVERLTGAIDRIVAQVRAEGIEAFAGSTTQNALSMDDREGAIILRNLMHHAPEFGEWLQASAAARIVATVIGADNVRFWMDASFLKEGTQPGTATPWHNDVCTFPFWGEHMPSFWVALTDVPEDNAPMRTLTGSHRDPFRYHSPLSRQDIPTPAGYRPWSELLERAEAADAPIRVWPAQAGDAMLIHPKTIHSSLPRRSSAPGRRLAFTTRWLGSDVVWQPDELAVRIPSLDNHPLMRRGCPPPEELFPVLWPR